MAGSLVIDGDNATVSFVYTATVEKAQATIEKYGKTVYHEFPFYDGNDEIVPFDSLTPSQKVSVVDQKIRKIIVTAAENQLENELVQIAREEAANDTSIGIN